MEQFHHIGAGRRIEVAGQDRGNRVRLQIRFETNRLRQALIIRSVEVNTDESDTLACSRRSHRRAQRGSRLVAIGQAQILRRGDRPAGQQSHPVRSTLIGQERTEQVRETSQTAQLGSLVDTFGSRGHAVDLLQSHQVGLQGLDQYSDSFEIQESTGHITRCPDSHQVIGNLYEGWLDPLPEPMPCEVGACQCGSHLEEDRWLAQQYQECFLQDRILPLTRDQMDEYYKLCEPNWRLYTKCVPDLLREGVAVPDWLRQRLERYQTIAG